MNIFKRCGIIYKKERKTMKFIKIIIPVIFILSIFAKQLLALEEPAYKVIKEYDDVEIREYKSYIVAETIVSSDFEEAGNMAFSSLFNYIDGENISQESIEMTAPVSQENIDSTGQEIEMTTPVSQEMMANGTYRVAFVMPERFTLETLPKPKDDRVQIREVPAKKVAVIRYSGTWSQENYDEHEGELYSFLSENGFEIVGKPIWARYDPPFMPWLFRRNEIMIEIK
jgi:effector-binding domain-containing protein